MLDDKRQQFADLFAWVYLCDLGRAHHQVVDVVVQLQLPLGGHLLDVGTAQHHFTWETEGGGEKHPKNEFVSVVAHFIHMREVVSCLLLSVMPQILNACSSEISILFHNNGISNSSIPPMVLIKIKWQ